MRPLALSGVLISEAAMVIYSPPSIKMGFGGRNTNAFRSVSQSGHGEHSVEPFGGCRIRP
jgi:hypothetical protein